MHAAEEMELGWADVLGGLGRSSAFPLFCCLRPPTNTTSLGILPSSHATNAKRSIPQHHHARFFVCSIAVYPSHKARKGDNKQRRRLFRNRSPAEIAGLGRSHPCLDAHLPENVRSSFWNETRDKFYVNGIKLLRETLYNYHQRQRNATSRLARAIDSIECGRGS